MKPLLDLTDVNYTYQTAEGETPAVKNLSFVFFRIIFSVSSVRADAENRQFYP